MDAFDETSSEISRMLVSDLLGQVAKWRLRIH
jgi:hypothetical protein